MRKTLPYLGVWIVAGLLAVTLARVGVSMVTERVTVDRPAPLSATQVRDKRTRATETPLTDELTTTTIGSNPVDPASPIENPSDPSTSDPSTSDPSPSGGSPTATSAPPTGNSGTGPNGPAPTGPAVTTASVTRTYDLVGGTVTLRFTSAQVTVLTATPKAGFSVDIDETHENGTRVEFESEDHRSRVDAWWDGGPQDEVREEDESFISP